MQAAVYLRISSDPSGRQLGVTRQREDCLKLCAAKGWTPVEFVDNDVSASSGRKRPEYERMLAAIRDGEIGAVVCWDLDRLHRRPIELEAFMALADERQVALASVSGDIDLGTAQGRLMARLKGSVAAHETEHKSARQRRALRQKADNGRPHWTKAFGYRPGPSGPTPDPETAPLVTRAYADLLAGCSLRDIARQWNTAGALTTTGGRWAGAQVGAFLRNPRNAGLRAYRREIIGPASWEPLVDENIWRAAQGILTAPGRAPVKAVRKHLLTGLLLCGICGPPTTLRGFRDNAGRPSYRCRGCLRIRIAACHVEQFTYDLVAGRLAQADAIDLLKAEAHDVEETERLRAQANTLHAQLDQLGRDYAEGLVNGRQLKIATDVIEAKLAANQRAQQDSERLRVFDGLPLGSDDVTARIRAISSDRFRVILDVLCEITIMPTGKRGKVFDPSRVKVAWRT